MICIPFPCRSAASKARDAISPLFAPSLRRAAMAPRKLRHLRDKVHILVPIHINLEASMWSIYRSTWSIYILIWSTINPLPTCANHGHRRSCSTAFRFTLYPCIPDNSLIIWFVKRVWCMGVSWWEWNKAK